MRADLQRFYNLNLDEMGAAFSCSQAAACIVNLPLGSKLLARIDPRLSWSVAEHHLFAIMCAIAGEDLPYPWEEEERSLPDFGTIPVSEMESWLNQNWREVEE